MKNECNIPVKPKRFEFHYKNQRQSDRKSKDQNLFINVSRSLSGKMKSVWVFKQIVDSDT